MHFFAFPLYHIVMISLRKEISRKQSWLVCDIWRGRRQSHLKRAKRQVLLNKNSSTVILWGEGSGYTRTDGNFHEGSHSLQTVCRFVCTNSQIKQIHLNSVQRAIQSTQNEQERNKYNFANVYTLRHIRKQRSRVKQNIPRLLRLCFFALPIASTFEISRWLVLTYQSF